MDTGLEALRRGRRQRHQHRGAAGRPRRKRQGRQTIRALEPDPAEQPCGGLSAEGQQVVGWQDGPHRHAGTHRALRHPAVGALVQEVVSLYGGSVAAQQAGVWQLRGAPAYLIPRGWQDQFLQEHPAQGTALGISGKPRCEREAPHAAGDAQLPADQPRRVQ